MFVYTEVDSGMSGVGGGGGGGCPYSLHELFAVQWAWRGEMLTPRSSLA